MDDKAIVGIAVGKIIGEKGTFLEASCTAGVSAVLLRLTFCCLFQNATDILTDSEVKVYVCSFYWRV